MVKKTVKMKSISQPRLNPPSRMEKDEQDPVVMLKMVPDPMPVLGADDERVESNLNRVTELHRARRRSYGTDYKRTGPALAAMFPGGVYLETAKEFSRFNLLLQIHGKLNRYATRFKQGGHADSLDDISVYAQILRRVDEEQEGS